MIGIMQSLIEQSKMPSGVLGKMLLRIMNNAHHSLTLWGLSGLHPAHSVLDVSCGGGHAISLLADMGQFEKIYGIDYSKDAVSLAISKNQKNIEKKLVTILHASVLELPFENNYFDAITTFQSHYHWPDICTAMKEIYRVLKPGGQFIMVAETYKMEYHMTEYNNAEQTKTLFEISGFRNNEIETNQKCIRVIGYKC